MDKIQNIDQLTRYLDQKYPFSKDPANYSDLIHSMSGNLSLMAIISTCNIIYHGIIQPPYFYYPDYNEIKPILLDYYNSCVREWFVRQPTPSLNDFCKAYINIRKGGDTHKLLEEKEAIKEYAISKGLNTASLSLEIDRSLENYQKQKRSILPYAEGTNGYNDRYGKLKETCLYLLDHGYFSTSLTRHFFYDKYIDDVEKQIKIEERKKKELEQKKKEEEQKKKDKKRKSRAETISIVIGVIIFIVILFFLVQLPGEIWNWIMGFFLWLWFMKWAFSK